MATAIASVPVFFPIPDHIWTLLEPLLAQAIEPHKGGKGRPRRAARQTMAEIFLKLRTGDGWHDTAAGTSGQKFQKKLLVAGVWPSIWTIAVTYGEQLGFTQKDLIAATNWQLQKKDITGTIESWLGPVAAAVDLAYRTHPIKKPRKVPPSGLRGDHIYSIPDPLWENIKPIIEGLYPEKQRGRKRLNSRGVLDGILHHARSGGQWTLTPERFGHYSTVHKRMSHWQSLGVFDAIFHAIVRHADELGLVDWNRQAIDGSLRKAKRRGEATGDNPTDRAKGGCKTSLLVDGNGYPLAIFIAGANVPDMNMAKQTLERSAKPLIAPAHMLMVADRGYRGQNMKTLFEGKGFEFRTPPRDRDDPYGINDRPLTKEEKQVRGRVERCHSWFNNYRSVAIRQSRKQENYQAVMTLTAALIWWRRITKPLVSVDC
ncbi:MAG: IS5 family transposase [Proteobacteria bacterium]|nr:IS5 family transposase [Pseudomonadota bacterium]